MHDAKERKGCRRGVRGSIVIQIERRKPPGIVSVCEYRIGRRAMDDASAIRRGCIGSHRNLSQIDRNVAVRQKRNETGKRWEWNVLDRLTGLAYVLDPPESAIVRRKSAG